MFRENRLFNFLFKITLFAVCLLSASNFALAQAQIESPLPRPTAPVSDLANVIDQPTEQNLNDQLKRLQAQTKIEIAVVTIGTTGGQEIFDYSLAVSRGWGIGSKEDDNPSLLLLVAIDDRKYYTQVSRDLEGDLPDSAVGQIQREKLVPPFRQGRYAQGINDTVNAYIYTLSQKRGFTLENTGNEPTKNQTRRGAGFSRNTVCCLVIVVIIIFIILMNIGNRGSGGGSGRNSSGWRGGGFGGIIPIFIPTGGWGGGSSSGGWGGGDSGGGSDWGGFGGGGDFGGGGSGGDW